MKALFIISGVESVEKFDLRNVDEHIRSLNKIISRDVLFESALEVDQWLLSVADEYEGAGVSFVKGQIYRGNLSTGEEYAQFVAATSKTLGSEGYLLILDHLVSKGLLKWHKISKPIHGKNFKEALRKKYPDDDRVKDPIFLENNIIELTQLGRSFLLACSGAGGEDP
ncbi:MAG: hypothetical protein AAGC57_11705 [Pseudomonadota bacterium]